MACLELRIVYSSCNASLAHESRGDNSAANLTRGVDDVTIIVDAVVADSFREGALDGGIVRLDEVILDVLYNVRGFACRERGQREGSREEEVRSAHRLSGSRARRSFSS